MSNERWVSLNQFMKMRNIGYETALDRKEITVNAVTNLDGKVLTRTVNKVNKDRKLQYGY